MSFQKHSLSLTYHTHAIVTYTHIHLPQGVIKAPSPVFVLCVCATAIYIFLVKILWLCHVKLSCNSDYFTGVCAVPNMALPVLFVSYHH